MPVLSRGKLYLGIDPGEKGGLALVEEKRGSITPLAYTEMPDSIFGIFDWLENAGDYGTPQLTIIEQVSSFPGMGVSGAFNFGGNYFALQMALTALRYPFVRVIPQTWQKQYHLPPRGKTNKEKAEHKERLRQIAMRLFPKPSDLWHSTLKVQRGVCDALLIARHAWMLGLTSANDKPVSLRSSRK